MGNFVNALHSQMAIRSSGTGPLVLYRFQIEDVKERQGGKDRSEGEELSAYNTLSPHNHNDHKVNLSFVSE